MPSALLAARSREAETDRDEVTGAQRRKKKKVDVETWNGKTGEKHGRTKWKERGHGAGERETDIKRSTVTIN